MKSQCQTPPSFANKKLLTHVLCTVLSLIVGFIRLRQGRLRWGAGGVAALSAQIHWGQEGQELPFILIFFQLSFLL